MSRFLDRDLDLGKRHPHGGNIAHKLRDSSVQSDPIKHDLITEIANAYLNWRDSAAEVGLPESPETTREHVRRQTELYEQHRNVLDDPRVDSFDSRGALQSSALEEFCYFLFKPFLDRSEEQKAAELTERGIGQDFDVSVAVGHQDVFHGLYFTSSSFSNFLELPTAQYPVVNIDFFIGKKVESTIATDVGESKKTMFVPAVAIECKTYVDRPRWGAADNSAAAMKAGFPRCMYVLLSEFLKLDLETVNVTGSRVDRFYVLRRQKNKDRRVRRAKSLQLPPMHLPAVMDFYNAVIDHLTTDWEAAETWSESGIVK